MRWMALFLVLLLAGASAAPEEGQDEGKGKGSDARGDERQDGHSADGAKEDKSSSNDRGAGDGSTSKEKGSDGSDGKAGSEGKGSDGSDAKKGTDKKETSSAKEKDSDVPPDEAGSQASRSGHGKGRTGGQNEGKSAEGTGADQAPNGQGNAQGTSGKGHDDHAANSQADGVAEDRAKGRGQDVRSGPREPTPAPDAEVGPAEALIASPPVTQPAQNSTDPDAPAPLPTDTPTALRLAPSEQPVTVPVTMPVQRCTPCTGQAEVFERATARMASPEVLEQAVVAAPPHQALLWSLVFGLGLLVAGTVHGFRQARRPPFVVDAEHREALGRLARRADDAGLDWSWSRASTFEALQAMDATTVAFWTGNDPEEIRRWQRGERPLALGEAPVKPAAATQIRPS